MSERGLYFYLGFVFGISIISALVDVNRKTFVSSAIEVDFNEFVDAGGW